MILEDVESWVSILSRAARRAGVSEVVVCENLQMLQEELRIARFDVALLDIGLDPADDLNADGIAAIEMIRNKDGGGTRCVLVTGWQGGDRMDLMAAAQHSYGVDWAFMKEKYDAHALIAKLTELLEEAPARRLVLSSPMENLSSSMEPYMFESQLLGAISPAGGLPTLYSAVSRLISPVIPLVAMYPDAPIKASSDGALVGVYWSRALAAAVAVSLISTDSRGSYESDLSVNLNPFMITDVEPDLIEQVRERNVLGRLWELPGLGIDKFAIGDDILG